jgi:hypothetical protein
MKVANLMKRPVHTVSPDTGVIEMTLGMPEPTLADEVMRPAARDAWR